jgi:hypothetical protein
VQTHASCYVIDLSRMCQHSPPERAKPQGLKPVYPGHCGRVTLESSRRAKYGSEPGVLFYTHFSDQYAPFYTKVINANVRDATHVLDGLLYHESQLRIEEHYTDTAGFIDQVFALCHMLGFEFAPGSPISPTSGFMSPASRETGRTWPR